MTAQILQFPRAAKRKPLAPVGQHACQVIALIDWRASQRRIAATGIPSLGLSAHQPGQLGA